MNANGSSTEAAVWAGAGLTAVFWLVFFGVSRHGTKLQFLGLPFGTAGGVVRVVGGALVLIAATAVGVFAALKAARNPRVPAWMIAALAVWLVLIVLGLFAAEYYTLGTKVHWSAPLTHAGAMYVALGTLTTAGTGELSATDDLARLLLSAQMAIDLMVVSVFGAIVLHRLTE